MFQKPSFLLVFPAVCLMTLFAKCHAQVPDIFAGPDITLSITDYSNGTGTIAAYLHEDQFDLGDSVSIRPLVGSPVFVFACIEGTEIFLGIAPNGVATDIMLPDHPTLAGTTITLKFRNRNHAEGTADIQILN